MAERRRGPVKPPTLDLTARPASGNAKSAAPTPAPDSAMSSTQPPDDPNAGLSTDLGPTSFEDADLDASETRADTPSSAAKPAAETQAQPRPNLPPRRPSTPPAASPLSILLPLLGGAVLGTALTLLLAALGVWPGSNGNLETETRLSSIEAWFAEQEARTEANTASIATLSADLDTEGNAVATRLDDLTGQIAPLGTAIADLQATTGEAQSIDLSSIERELAELSTRLDAVASGASPEDAGRVAGELSALSARLDTLAAEFDAIETRLSDTDTAIATLQAGAAAQPSAPVTLDDATVAAAIRLPLLLDGLETAFNTGRPYLYELTQLGEIAPVLVPPVVAAGAETGLVRPDALRDRFAATFPAILAARPLAEGEWQDQAWDRVRAILALRPASEMDGDDPEAVASRLEAAMARGDFAAAETLMAQLPEPMRDAAGTLPAEISAHAAAVAFVARVRAEGLTAGAASAP